MSVVHVMVAEVSVTPLLATFEIRGGLVAAAGVVTRSGLDGAETSP
jgi:hypothetical protein